MKAPGFSQKPQASTAAAQEMPRQHQGPPPRTAHTGNSYGGNGYGSGNPRASKAVVPARGGGGYQPQGKQNEVSLLSNQYRLTLGQNACVFQYVLDIKPEEFWEAHRVHEIIKTKKTSLEKALGAYVVSGKTIYTLTELEESLIFKTTFKGEQA